MKEMMIGRGLMWASILAEHVISNAVIGNEPSLQEGTYEWSEVILCGWQRKLLLRGGKLAMAGKVEG